ncbi:MAG: hypothetical protein IJ829_07085 [Kiritimatiellae bacterium]|nr:hypothetical protein [Kiritimatiellia bacterium]
MRTRVFAVLLFAASGAAALAEGPCVLELGYRPSTNETPVVVAPAPAAEGSPAAAAAAAAPAESVTDVAAPETNVAARAAARPAKITADTTVYNRKEGVASFAGHVHVDDEQYQMHADRVYLFLEGTNDLQRIVAIGHVAVTNETRRAYGAKATYAKKNGLVVLHSGDGVPAELRDEANGQERSVRGKKIRFWIGAEQVEVDEADMTGTAPAGGAESLKKAFGK